MKLPEEPEALLFDIDGTLADSHHTLIIPTYRSTAKQFGLNTEPLLFPEFRSCTLRRAYELMSVTQEMYPEVMAAHVAFQRQNMHLLQEIAGARQALKVLARHFKMGVVTNRTGNGRDLLRQCGHLEYIEVVVGPEDVTHPKPNRECVDVALKTLGVPHHKTVVIGDTHLDVETGKNAGAMTIAITTLDCPESLGMLDRSGPDCIVSSYEELLALLL